MNPDQIDIFGATVDTTKREKEARKRYRTMQSVFGTKDGYRCKTCKHCECHHYHGRNYYKCAIWHQSHSAATDIRANGIACGKYESEGADDDL